MTPDRFQSRPPQQVEQVHKKQTLFEKIDAALRDKDTAFAKLLEAISPEKGEEYLNSNVKRFLDLSIAIPAAVISTPIITILGIAKKLEDGGTAFFVQERYRKFQSSEQDSDDTFQIWKIRSMVEGAEKDAENIAVRGSQEKHDPRATSIGKVMRKYKLDELPQLYQVVSGQLSLVGVRPIPSEPLARIQKRHAPNHVERCIFEGWKQEYGKGKKGLTGITQVRESGKRIDEEAFHYDTFYTKNASLGLDLYLLWATLGRILDTYPQRKSRAKEVKE